MCIYQKIEQYSRKITSYASPHIELIHAVITGYEYDFALHVQLFIFRRYMIVYMYIHVGANCIGVCLTSAT